MIDKIKLALLPDRVRSAVLNSEVADASFVVVSQDRDLSSVAVVVAAGSSELTAEKVGSELRVTRADKSVMKVVANFGAGQETVFLPLVMAVNWALNIGNLRYQVVATVLPSGWYLSKKIDSIVVAGFAITVGSGPDGVDWSSATKTGSATGTPEITAHLATAAQVITSLNTLDGITAFLSTDNDGTALVEAETVPLVALANEGILDISETQKIVVENGVIAGIVNF